MLYVLLFPEQNNIFIFFFYFFSVTRWYRVTQDIYRNECMVIIHTFCKCLGKWKIVGTASSCRWTLVVVQLKHDSLKWSEHSLSFGEGWKSFSLKFQSHCCCFLGFFGNLQQVIEVYFFCKLFFAIQLIIVFNWYDCMFNKLQYVSSVGENAVKFPLSTYWDNATEFDVSSKRPF